MRPGILIFTLLVGTGAQLLSAKVVAPPAGAQSTPAALSELRDKALHDPLAMKVLEGLTSEIGARQVGSENFVRARDWAVKKLQALGFQNVHTEPFTLTAWTRGEERAHIVAPYPQKLAIIGLGGTLPTPVGGVDAEIVLFKKYASLLDAPPGSLAGKIAVVTESMAPGMGGYAALGKARRLGPAEAAKRGAVAYLVRSLGNGSTRLPHTGFMSLDAPTVPAAALSAPDAELLERIVERGAPVRIHLELASSTHPAQSWNTVGEIPGATDEMVLMGAHLDSWDVGTGANDDGAGVAIAVAAAKLAGETHLRRTLRVVLYGGEEIGVAGPAYAQYNSKSLEKIVIAGESDSGSEPAIEVRLPAGGAQNPALADLTGALSPLAVRSSSEPSRGGGPDIEPLNDLGVPGLEVVQRLENYFRWHHTEDDTLDKVVPEELSQNVATWAVLLRVMADRNVVFERKTAEPAK
jgi:Zn-dependent M28 family amino/carboxypeptidase